MNTTENNKIIAEFMEWEVVESLIDNRFWVDCNPTNEQYPLQLLSEIFKNWDWLMEVVDKIFENFYKLNPCPIYLKMNIEKALIGVDKESVYNACVEFINFYSQNGCAWRRLPPQS